MYILVQIKTIKIVSIIISLLLIVSSSLYKLMFKASLQSIKYCINTLVNINTISSY